MKKTLMILATLFVLTSCNLLPGKKAEPTPEPTATEEIAEVILPTETPTPPPSIARVENVYIWDDDFNGKREQLRDAYQSMGQAIPADEELNTEALNRLTEEAIFLVAAERMGLRPNSSEVEERIASLAQKMGGEGELRDWQNRNHYSDDGLRRAMEREMSITRVKERVLAERLPQTEQVHAYRISVDSRSQLEQVRDQLNMGIAFPELAKNFDTLSGGDMGWLPKNVLFDEVIEGHIFALSPGAWTDIIERNGKYDMYYVSERQTGHELSAQVRPVAEHSVMSQWLEEQKNSMTIERLH